eukprot:gene6397-10404_t
MVKKGKRYCNVEEEPEDESFLHLHRLDFESEEESEDEDESTNNEFISLQNYSSEEESEEEEQKIIFKAIFYNLDENVSDEDFFKIFGKTELIQSPIYTRETGIAVLEFKNEKSLKKASLLHGKRHEIAKPHALLKVKISFEQNTSKDNRFKELKDEESFLISKLLHLQKEVAEVELQIRNVQLKIGTIPKENLERINGFNDINSSIRFQKQQQKVINHVVKDVFNQKFNEKKNTHSNDTKNEDVKNRFGNSMKISTKLKKPKKMKKIKKEPVFHTTQSISPKTPKSVKSKSPKTPKSTNNPKTPKLKMPNSSKKNKRSIKKEQHLFE